MSRPRKPTLSPSLYHRRVMAELPPAMRYDGGDVKRWQQRLRRKVRELMGRWPQDRVPLNVRSLWKRDHAPGSIEKIVFTSELSVDVPAYVCLPRDTEPPYPFMVCLQGHSSGMHNSIAVDRDDETKSIEVPGDRDFALGCMRRGVAALCIEQRAFGERREQAQQKVAQHGCHDAVVQALMLGKTLLGERVFDVDRGIDCLASRQDVDMARLGVMGNSGGGTATIYASALLPRVRLAVPSCAFCTYRDGLMAIVHCMCAYIPRILQYAEMADVQGLFAPKPVIVVAGDQDPISPVAAVRRAYADLRRIYRSAGAEDRCHLVVARGPHRFYADKAWPVILRELDRMPSSR